MRRHIQLAFLILVAITLNLSAAPENLRFGRDFRSSFTSIIMDINGDKVTGEWGYTWTDASKKTESTSVKFSGTVASGVGKKDMTLLIKFNGDTPYEPSKLVKGCVQWKIKNNKDGPFENQSLHIPVIETMSGQDIKTEWDFGTLEES